MGDMQMIIQAIGMVFSPINLAMIFGGLILGMIVGCIPFFYFAFNAEKIALTDYAVVTNDPMLLGFAVIGILAMVELCRRSVGLPILCVAGILILYTLFGANIRLGKALFDLFYTCIQCEVIVSHRLPPY